MKKLIMLGLFTALAAGTTEAKKSEISKRRVNLPISVVHYNIANGKPKGYHPPREVFWDWLKMNYNTEKAQKNYKEYKKFRHDLRVRGYER